MNLEEFGINILQYLLASVPQLTVILSTIIFTLNKVKANTAAFPNKIAETKTVLTASFDEAKNNFVEIYKNAKTDMEDIVKNTVDEIKKNVNNTLTDMGAELSKYKDELSEYKGNIQNLGSQVNLLVKENKCYLDVIEAMIAKDGEKIRDGVASIVATKLNMTREELERYPEKLVSDIPVLQNAIKEIIAVTGQDNFDKIMGVFGYARRLEETKEEELQTQE